MPGEKEIDKAVDRSLKIAARCPQRIAKFVERTINETDAKTLARIYISAFYFVGFGEMDHDEAKK